MVEIDYYSKYQKYKQKYLKQKNNNFIQEGGEDKIYLFYILVEKKDYDNNTKISIDEKKELSKQIFYFKNNEKFHLKDLINISFCYENKNSKLINYREPSINQQDNKFKIIKSFNLNESFNSNPILKKNIVLEIQFKVNSLFKNELQSYNFYRYDTESNIPKKIKCDSETATFFIFFNEPDKIQFETCSKEYDVMKGKTFYKMFCEPYDKKFYRLYYTGRTNSLFWKIDFMGISDIVYNKTYETIEYKKVEKFVELKINNTEQESLKSNPLSLNEFQDAKYKDIMDIFKKENKYLLIITYDIFNYSKINEIVDKKVYNKNVDNWESSPLTLEIIYK
jgi:hypothetical protein